MSDGDGQGPVVISNASCTTNCITPVAAVIHKKFGISKGDDDDSPCLYR